MNFSITDKNNCIHVKVQIKEPTATHSFFPLVDSMSKEIKDVFLQKKLPVVFDLLELRLIDSYMISILVQIFRLTEPVQNAILASDQQVIDVLTLIGIDKMYDIFYSEEEWLHQD